MKFRSVEVRIGVLSCILSSMCAVAQSGGVSKMFADLRAKAAADVKGTDNADPVLEGIPNDTKGNVLGELPVILNATTDSYVSVRRIAAMALWEVSRRSDGQVLLSGDTPTFTALLLDPDLPVRRVSMLAVATLRPNIDSPIMPFLKSYLGREDAVVTIGAFVATVLMEAAPHDNDTLHAVVEFMRRPDQTPESQEALLNAIRYRARSQNADLAKEVAAYANSPDEPISILAIETLQGMGQNNVRDNQSQLSRIAADTERPLRVRTAASKALSRLTDPPTR